MTKSSAAVVLGLLLGTAATVAFAANEPDESWHFVALLDGKPIGTHDFLLTHHDDMAVLDNTARFKVTIAMIPVYGYDHRDHEVWRDGCVIAMSSQTNDNGRRLLVEGAKQGDGFEIHGSQGEATLPACVHTFAYWDQTLLTAPRLLNAQTGEYQAVTLTSVGLESLNVTGHSMIARRYAIRAPHLSIDVWYSEAGRWVALESRLENGRVLRYEISGARAT